jgi:hypothetical protein
VQVCQLVEEDQNIDMTVQPVDSASLPYEI